MHSIIDKPIVLALNAAWQVIGHRTVRQALVALNGGDGDNPPAVGLDIAYPKTEEGWDFDRPVYLNPTKWDAWVKLPVRDFDLTISTATLKIRVPTVIVATQFAKMPLKRPRLCRRTIRERDGGRCQYTGQLLRENEGNIDHVVPRDRGGRDTWENLVLCSTAVNSAKGNRLNHEAGLKLIRAPKAPAAIPISASIRDAAHPDWNLFLTAR